MHKHKIRTSVALMVLGTYVLTLVPTHSIFVYGATPVPIKTQTAPVDVVFDDVENDAWHAAAIAAMNAKGYLDSTERTFRPNENATRAELVSLVLRVKGGTAATAPATGYPFVDVRSNTPAYQDLYQAMMQGWFKGDRDCAGVVAGCTARPDAAITRAETSALLTRAFDLTDLGSDRVFGDIDPLAWFAPAMRTLTSRCILRGDDVPGQDGVILARPASNVSRAEMAVLLGRIDDGAVCDLSDDSATTALTSPDEAVLARLLRSARDGQYLTAKNGRLTWTDPMHSAAGDEFQTNPGRGRRPAGNSGSQSDRHYGRGSSGGSSGGTSGGSTGGGSVTDIWVNETGDTMTGLLRILVAGVGLSVSGTASGDTLFAQKFLFSSGVSIFDGNARFNSTVTLNNVTYTFPAADGSASGKVLKTNAAGQLSWADDDATGSGLSLAQGDARYVRKSGDTMTGALTINITGGTSTTLGLKVVNTLSGAHLHAEKSLTSSGTLIVNDTALFKSTLRVLGSASGDTIHAEKSLTTSGTLVFEGAASGSSLFLGTSLRGSGLVDCDTGGTSKLLWDATTGRFSCGTDAGSNWSGTGALQSYFDNRYVNTSGDTMTGTLVISNGKNLQVAGTISGTTLKILGTASGNILHAEKSLTTSGTLVFEGAASGSSLYLGTSLNGAGLTDCDTAGTSKLLWDATTGRFSCGTDAGSNWSGTGALQSYFDNRYVNT
ncbi:MAG: S-layer homology domain-containing protein, partial [Candidatus Peribacteraceae bacterium]